MKLDVQKNRDFGVYFTTISVDNMFGTRELVLATGDVDVVRSTVAELEEAIAVFKRELQL